MNAPAERPSPVLRIALYLLVALYLAWFSGEWVALAVFALPPFACAIALMRGRRQAAFWAGVLALAWFSHGVMVAWSRPGERAFALAEVALAVVVVFAANLPGLRARFARKQA